MNKDTFVICRGGGDLATGIIHRLTKAGFRVLVLESGRPSSIRRQVCFSEAVYDGTATVEGITAVMLDDNASDITRKTLDDIFKEGRVPVVVDENGHSIESLRPDVVIDAIIAKKNLGTYKEMADLVIGVGPGFTAGEDVHFAIETSRGHNLGRIIENGSPKPNTGIPGSINGHTSDRVIHSTSTGYIKNIIHIGDVVRLGQEMARIYTNPEFVGEYVSVSATLDGIVRGLIRENYYVTEGFKIADIDPREEELKNCFTISDKARCIAGSVLELVSGYANGEI